ncbi:catalase family peroxidase [Saccharopolyspora elongata]|uniref:Catalase-related peroxidase n=1 Tax=Saccharopolyspora elongata TaxID=2530387 RepID=A0A4R4YIW9_9PSEU|nr:catalase family peroxidase [Saccharopolyspora elongata]TDD44250.1 catalase family peroxidase [Saccharopolyspora elongata]
MNDDVEGSRLPRRSVVNRRSALLGLTGVAAASATSAGAFLYSGGWLSTDELTPKRIADGFEQVYGKHDGFRRNHAKGVSVSGFFDSNGSGAAVSRAAVFQGGRIPVTGRFSLSGGMPHATDAHGTIRGLGLLFHVPNGEQWRTALINIPVFPDRSVQGFYERLLASKPLPGTGKPDPQKMSGFLAQHPETAKAMEIIKANPPTSGFDNSTFNSLNTFLATNAADVTTAIRWSLVPTHFAAPMQAAAPAGKDYLFDELVGKVAESPLQWRLILTVGQPNDPTDDPTIPWTGDHQRIDAGMLTIDSVQTEASSNVRDTNFDPLVLPDGLAASDDPLLSARSAVYAQSFTRRAGEPKHPGAIDVAKEPR